MQQLLFLFAYNFVMDALRTGDKLITRVFYMLECFENWGSGTLKILDQIRQVGKSKPNFLFQDGIFQ